MVQGYCEPSKEDMWDEVAGVPLGDVWEELLRLREGSKGEIASLREEIERLREGNKKEIASLREEHGRLREGSEGEIASLRRENERLREELERLKEAAAGRKRGRDDKQDAGRSDSKRGRGSSGGGLP